MDCRQLVRLIDYLRYPILGAWLVFALLVVTQKRPQQFFALLDAKPAAENVRTDVNPADLFREATTPDLGWNQPYPLPLTVAVRRTREDAPIEVAKTFLREMAFGLRHYNPVVDIEGYGLGSFEGRTTDETEELGRLVSRNQSMVLLQATLRPSALWQLYTFFDATNGLMQNLTDSVPGFKGSFEAEAMSVSKALREAKDSLVSSMAVGDVVSVGFAVAVLILRFGLVACSSVPVLVLSLLLFMRVTIEFEKIYKFAVFEPSLFFSLAAALSLDYCLFVLSSYEEAVGKMEKRNGNNAMGVQDLRACMETVLLQAGHPVVLSAFVLAASFISLCFLEFEIARCIGIGGAVVVGSCVLVTLTFLPAVLMIRGRLQCGCCRVKLGLPLSERPAHAGSLWQRFAIFCKRYPVQVLMLFLVVFSSSIPFLQQIHVTADDMLMLPKDSQTLRMQADLAREALPSGLFAPFYLVLLPKKQTIEDYAQQQLQIYQSSRSRDTPSRDGCEDQDILLAAEAMHHFPDLRAKRALLSCASAEALKGICRKQAAHVIDLCPKTCKNCSWQQIGNCSVMTSLDGKWCRHGDNQYTDADSPEDCREHCCTDPSCTFWQFQSGVGCFVGRAVTRPVCEDKEKGSTSGELLYRPWFSQHNFWMYQPYWEDSKEAVSRMLSVLERNGWQTCNSCLHSILRLPNGSQLTPEAARQSLRSSLPYAQHFLRLTGQDPRHPFGQHIRIDLPFPTFSADAESFFRKVQAEFSSPLRNDCCHVVVLYLNQAQVDEMDTLYAKIWRAILGTSTVVMLIIGLAFRSAVIPARLLFTMIFTLSTSFAAAVVFFQFYAGQPGLHWIVPLCATPIIIGLTLDYDLFLLLRVARYRSSGFSTADAVVRGCRKIGETITLAGVIMSAAFSSMLCSKFRVIQQFGFLLVAASLMDAFLVRGLLVPSIMLAMKSESNWWPRRMPPVRRSAEEDSEDEDYTEATSMEMAGVAQGGHYVDMSTDVEDAG